MASAVPRSKPPATGSPKRSTKRNKEGWSVIWYAPTSGREYPCPCCVYSCLENRQAPTTYSKICFWEDDLSPPRFVMMGGANLPLIKAQKNYTAFGASEKRFLHHARDPGPEGVRGTGLTSYRSTSRHH